MAAHPVVCVSCIVGVEGNWIYSKYKAGSICHHLCVHLCATLLPPCLHHPACSVFNTHTMQVTHMHSHTLHTHSHTQHYIHTLHTLHPHTLHYIHTLHTLYPHTTHTTSAHTTHTNPHTTHTNPHTTSTHTTHTTSTHTGCREALSVLSSMSTWSSRHPCGPC